MSLAPDPVCHHLDGVVPVAARGRGCEECLVTGGRWLHLRRCLHCGHVGCCEEWRWCFVDEVYPE